MKSARLACLFVILISLLVLAQSSRDQLANQSNGLTIAQQPHPELLPNLSRMQQKASLAQHSTGVSKATALGRGARPLQGLSFAPAVVYASGGIEAFSVVAADLNGDGKPDLVVANLCGSSYCASEGSVSVLLGNGDGTFQAALPYGSGGYHAFSVAVGDVNGDGKPDLIVANECMDSGCNSNGSVGVLLGTGDGTFQPAVTFDSGGLSTQSVAVADVNGDGKLDLLVANGGIVAGTVGVLLGNGDGTFQPAVAYNSGGYDADSVAVADVNGDGKPDLVVASLCIGNSSNCPNGVVGVLLGNGDGTFQTVVNYGTGGWYALSAVVADVNGDGKPDLLVANEFVINDFDDGAVGVLLGNGDGTFQTATAYTSGGSAARSVAVGDVNGDGKPDLISANCGTSGGNTCTNGMAGVLLGNGDGTFQPAVSFSTGGSDADAIAVVDVNGDGKSDLLVANRGEASTEGSVGVLLNSSTDATTTALISSPNPSSFGEAVTFTATVTAQPGFYKGPPTGSASFFDGGTNIGNSNLNSSGVATLTTSSLSVGTHSITATYNGSTNFAASTSPVLYQVVQGAVAVLSPAGLNFGNQTVGIASASKNVMLTNTGNINLAISLVQITGADTGDFSQNNNCPASLPPNGSCIISAVFTPLAVGTRNAAVSVTDNAPGSPQSASLTGVGVLPAVTFSPNNLTFPTQLVFTDSKAQQVTLTNTGLGILKITAGGISGQFGETTNCTPTLAPGASCTANVTFKPTTKGTLNGAISITDNAPGSPQRVPLSGTGTYVQLKPTSENFGSQPINTTSLPRYITFTNKGSGPVNFTGTGISITGTDQGDFAETNNCGTSVASGASCKIKVTFTPLQLGTRTADVSISDDGGGSPQTVPLTGTGTP